MPDSKRIFKLHQYIEFSFYLFIDQFFGRKLLYRIFLKRRQKFNKNVFEVIKKRGKAKVMPIDRRKNLSLEEFKQHYRKKGIPVIFEGAAKDWNCTKSWSLEYLKELHGKDVIGLTDYHLAKNYETTTLGDVIDNIRTGGGKYYRFYPLLNRHPEHIKDFDYQWLFDRKNKRIWFETWQVFIGGKDGETSTHSENQCNLFVQAYGVKDWVIYPGSFSMAMDPTPGRTVYRNPGTKKDKQPFNSFSPDYETYPEYLYIDRYEGRLNPGDVLFNPCFAWHTVKNVSDSISVGYRWVSPFYALKLNTIFMFLDMIAVNPTIRKAFKLYAEDTNLIRIAESGHLEDYLKERATQEKLQTTS